MLPWFSTGKRMSGPLLGVFRRPGRSSDERSIIPGWCKRARAFIYEDFLGKAIPGHWNTATVQTAGTPTAALDSSIADGTVKLLLDATNEAQSARLDWNDKVAIAGNGRVLFEALVKFGTIGANERAVVGLATAYNATLDNIAENLWFRLEGSMALLIEGDDNTTDTDDQSAGKTLTAGSWYLLQICAINTNAVAFFVDGNSVGTVSVSALTAAMLMQPFAIVQKASGTGTPSATVDFVFAEWDRTN